MNTKSSQSLRSLLTDFFRLNKNYIKAKGDYIYYIDDEGNEVKVLDLVGGYGINLLGHNHPNIISKVEDIIHTHKPNFQHFGDLLHKQKFENLFSTYLNEETLNHVDYNYYYTNSGSESIELALKFAWQYKNEQDKIYLQQINRTIALVKSEYISVASIFKTIGLNTKNEVLNYYKHIKSQINKISFLRLSNSFHGKTSGALSLMGNQFYSDNFPKAYADIIITEYEPIENCIERHKIPFYTIARNQKRLQKTDVFPIAAFCFEPIQGEGGLKQVDINWLDRTIQYLKSCGIIIISDEIQSGIFRTGKIAALHHGQSMADIYCFAKALSGGISKMGLVAITMNISMPKFALLHSSTFGGDYFSTMIANEVISLAQKSTNNHVSSFLHNELCHVKADFPEVVKDVSGLGYMQGITFNEKIAEGGYSTKFLYDMNVLGYAISTYFLEKHKIYILPTLSAPLTFRIQPSLFLLKTQVDAFIFALRTFCETAFDYQWLKYISNSHANFPLVLNELPDILKDEEIGEGASFFYCHPIDINHARNIVPIFNAYTVDEVDRLMNDLIPIQEFTPYHIAPFRTKDGQLKKIVFMGIPMTSQHFYAALKGGNRHLIVEKIQKSLDDILKYKPSSIGLGQFTSIITNNGLELESNIPLTTGNHYTVLSSILALSSILKDQGIELKNQKPLLVGITGNIISTIAIYLLNLGCSIDIMIPKKEHLYSVKLGQVLQNLLKSRSIILKLNEIKSLVEQEGWNDKFGDFIYLTTNNLYFKTAKIIITGTNSPQPIIQNSVINSDLILLDIAVPPDATLEVQQNQSITYLNGGMIQLPNFDNRPQSLNSVIFPFQDNECYACMAETIALAFAKDIPDNMKFTGLLSIDTLDFIAKITENVGFNVKGLKHKMSL